jgi:hypothetical protein
MKKLIYVLVLALLFGNMYSQKVELQFNEKGQFKIVQFTDIHYVTGREGTQESLRLMNRILDVEMPDFVMFTGDIITCKPQKPAWDDVLNVVIARQIPYAVVLGNHDDEHDWSREQIMNYVITQPYSLTQKGPDKIKGFGNFILPVKNRNGKTGALLYCLDSNAYNKVVEQKGYDWLGIDQINWYRKNSRSYTQKNNGNPYPTLAFFHIPLQEYTLLIDTTKNYVRNSPIFGVRKEKECPGIINTGMFAAMVECGDVIGVFAGHDHDNDYIGYLNGICLAYGRFTGNSENIYNSIGTGARIIELQENQKSFKTWIRTAENEVLYQVVYPDSFVKQ